MCEKYINLQTKEELDLEKVSTLPDNAMLKNNPELWVIWSFKKNLDIDIWKITKGKSGKVWWYCDKCDDEYPVPINKKTSGRGCSVCSGYYVTKKNSFGGKYLDLAKEWNYEKNDKSPFEYSKYSKIKVWWKGLECGHEWESSIHCRTKLKTGCSVCNGKTVLKGFNDMWTTAPHLAKLLLNPEDGYKYGKGTNVKLEWKCSTCGESLGLKYASTILRCSKNCHTCSDKTSLSERIMFNLLKYLKIEFKKEYIPNWSENKRYDYYIPSLNMIVEMHGQQHYKRGFETVGGLTLDEVKLNDDKKRELAKENGISEYIEIDCRKSDFEWIKNSILSSKLNEFLKLDSVNWKKVDPSSNDSMVKIISDMYNNGYEIEDIMSELNITRYYTISNLTKGKAVGLNNYTSKSNKHVIKYDLHMNEISKYQSVEDARKDNNISRYAIDKILKGEKDSHNGFVYKYDNSRIAI